MMSLSSEKVANSVFKHRSDVGPHLLCSCKLHVPDNGAEPFVRLASKHETEVKERHDVVPFVGDLAFIDACHKFERCNGVFSWLSIEIR